MQGVKRTLVAGLGAAALAVAGCATLAPVDTASASASAVDQTSVSIDMPDGTADALLFEPRARGKYPAVLLWSDVGGLRPAFADIGRKLASEGYVVLAPNMFYRSARITGAETPPPLTREQARERTTKWMGAISDTAIEQDAKAYLAYLDGRPKVDKRRKAGTLAYDYGSPYAFHTAMAMPERISAVAALYPVRIATARPNSPHLFVDRSKAAYFIAIAKPDDDREPGDKEDLRKAFADAGLPATVTVYPVGHGFGVSDQTAYDATATQQTWAAVTELFRSTLK
jgi:carboxymethylenebutenolidase